MNTDNFVGVQCGPALLEIFGGIPYGPALAELAEDLTSDLPALERRIWVRRIADIVHDCEDPELIGLRWALWASEGAPEGSRLRKIHERVALAIEDGRELLNCREYLDSLPGPFCAISREIADALDGCADSYLLATDLLLAHYGPLTPDRLRRSFEIACGDGPTREELEDLRAEAIFG